MLVNHNHTVIALIPDGWELKNLDEIAKLRKEIFKANKDFNLPYIGLEHIEQDSLRLISIGNSSEIISNKFKFYSDDILYGKLRPYFRKVYKPKFDGVCSTDIWVIKSNEAIDNNFLYYLIATEEFTNIANSGSTGTKMPRADWEQIKNTKWKIPRSINEQRNISKILASLDNKIELNQKMNETLEKIAQAIFKQWFIDFEFPNDEGKPYKSSGGAMIDSELGKIPAGWSYGNLSDLADVTIGGDWGKDSEFNNSVAAISLRGVDLENLKKSGYSKDAPLRWLKKDSLEKRQITENDILIGGSGLGPIGRSIYCHKNLYALYAVPITYSNFCKRLKAKKTIYATYVEQMIEYLYINELLNKYFTGTSIPNLDINNMLLESILIPPDFLLEKFFNIKYQANSTKFNKENILLENIRDSLLPKLMNGKIRVNINA